jgi:hypothetical protein
MFVNKGLIIADPWISYILEGRKTWEMRSQATSFRSLFGLIRKGTGAVWGVARLVDCGTPLSPEQMIANHDKHQIPDSMIRSGEVAKWNTPWMLSDVWRLATPVPYTHRSGAVTWVEFDPEVSAAIDRAVWLPADPASAGVPPRRSEESIVPKPVVPRGSEPTVRPVAQVAGTLIGQTELTDGNLKNSHIYLRGFFHRFPSDAIGGSNKGEAARRSIKVDWGHASSVETDLDGQKMFFRSRVIAKRFFEDTGAEAGDRVAVTETAPYCYSLALQKGR